MSHDMESWLISETETESLRGSKVFDHTSSDHMSESELAPIASYGAIDGSMLLTPPPNNVCVSLFGAAPNMSALAKDVEKSTKCSLPSSGIVSPKSGNELCRESNGFSVNVSSAVGIICATGATQIVSESLEVIPPDAWL